MRSLPVLLGAALLLAAALPRQAELATGALLVASDELLDPNFAETVVLLLRYGEDGAHGLVVNRPSTVELGSVDAELEIPEARSLPLYYGGPVQPGVVSFLLRAPETIAKGRAVVGDVQVAASAEAIAALLREPGGPARVRAYAGYAGWGPGQLDAEVARGDWLVLRGRSREVFDRDPGSLWRRLFDGGDGLEARGRRHSGARG